MSKVETKLDMREFAIWLRQRRAQAAAEVAPQGPSTPHRRAAARVWEVVQEGRAQAGRITFQPLKLAAADARGNQDSLEIPTEHGLLAFMRVGSSDQWRVVFKAEPDKIVGLQGTQPRLLIGGEELLLSEIDDRGLARADMPHGLLPGDLVGFEVPGS